MTLASHSRPHSALALLASLTLLLGACGGGSGSTAGASSTTTLAAPSTTTTTVAPTPSTTITAGPTTEGPGATTTASPEPVSQTPADALRDGVVPAVAELPMHLRVDIIDEVTTDEGVWAITRLGDGADELADGCRLGSAEGKYPEDFICTFEYGELLLLDDSRTSILRAYPLPGVPAEHIAVTDDAVYCGRHGALPMPDAMICRVDRATLVETVKVYQPGLDSLIVQPCFFPPPTWSVVEEPLDMLDLRATGDGVFAEATDGTWTMLDPATLLVVERGLDSPNPPS